MKPSYQKYVPFPGVPMTKRLWPTRTITHAPAWCSVDLRDGNQALVQPMNLAEKLEMFHLLVEVGFKEIEVGFPSASETEYEIIRTLIEGGHIPDDVTIQVLVQAREHLIRKTFEAIRGAKNVIIHLYNSTSTLQRKVVFKKDMDGIIDIAVQGARLIRTLAAEVDQGTHIRYEYSPESFSGTEPENAVAICTRVMEELGAAPENKIILNLPHTVECCMPNIYADEIEYFITHLPHRENAIISLHPHNDRGTGVAAAELGLLAGAERVEGSLFGNGERTGNLDIVTVALNMFTQGIDPELDFSNIRHVREVYERCTKMEVHPRHPYAGDLVFTAFSGSHQDAINKGEAYMRETNSPYWEVPYLPLDPADVGRAYEPIIRINSQSGKGGAAFVMQSVYGYELPKAMHPDFGHIVKQACDEAGTELLPQAVLDLFNRYYVNISTPYALKKYRFAHCEDGAAPHVRFEGVLVRDGAELPLDAVGNGAVDAFFKAVEAAGVTGYTFLSYSEQAVAKGSDSMALSYIALRAPDGSTVYGVGLDSDITIASIRGILSAINRVAGGQR
ncbi:2-isopropylmalate synthase [Ethanoligenens harbinense]|uniref:2-isopropylmalate synthase n=1 Tax=Ethanoligenens harbinense (strain DSM 18485 / JCM 12961 / CGMCC 1.5033 / YUAN-3) TaxID=663278 RepID=E6U731_ETHHY|nr:2-isopropylmalate synthase [Ethanoligenens harbinense]ADU28101.1 2-isopropylmalate synthase [Ethanoligenens harbinense YUAN-3]AVQ97110.1 2-isopropylmalate synthase [Ethanoligenens harbinense YUAN-3]AYF39772.1 2-isopropylmalate synthase [Ethanoligenens harbinense]AYF42604.1 2-isopropylmalate synthase [Ethanoligenens harbinense]QCN93353.1 2-isopropylmalate synthase [Ethanoligenens harbinense]